MLGEQVGIGVSDPARQGRDLDMRVQRLHRGGSGLGLGFAALIAAKDHLPLQVGQADGVVVRDRDPPHARRRQIQTNRRPQAARPHDQHPRVPQAHLARTADFAQHQMAGIAVQFGIGDPWWRGGRLIDRRHPRPQPRKARAIGQDKARKPARDQPAARRSAEDRAPARQVGQFDDRPEQRHRRQQPAARQAEDPSRRRDPDQQPEPQHRPQAPVEPKPPAARAVARLKLSTTVKAGRRTGTKIICAIRSPGWTMIGGDPAGFRFQELIRISPV